MTSPFVDRVEYQVVGRDTNASQVFRNVADAADSAGDSINGLGNDLDRVNRSIDDTANRMRELVSSLEDLSATRQITVTTNVREVLGSVEDNRQVLDLLNDRFENLTINVVATVNQLVQLNDGLTTIDDNRTAVITLDDDFRSLTQNVTATVDSVVSLNDGIQTIDDNRNVIVTVDDDFRSLTQNITATVDSVVNLNDGIQTIDDNRTAVITLDDDFQTLTQNIDATVNRVVDLNDGIQTIDDNRTAVITIDGDFQTLTQNVDATVNRVVDLRDGIDTIDDNRDSITNLGTDFNDLDQDIEQTRTVVIRFNDEIDTIDDRRPVLADLGNDFRNLGDDDIESSRLAIGRFNDEIDTVDDRRPVLANLGNGFDDLGAAIERSRGHVGDLNRDIDRLPNNLPDGDERIHRTIVETVKSDRDRFEEAGIIAGAALSHGVIVALGQGLNNGFSDLPIVGPVVKAVKKILAFGPEIAAPILAVVGTVAASAAIVFVNAFTGGILLGLGGGVIAAGLFAAFQNEQVRKAAKEAGGQIADKFGEAFKASGFTGYVLDAIEQVKNGFTLLTPEITEIFKQAGPLIKPLTDSLLGFIREALPGIATAMGNLRPVFDMLAEHGPKLGKAFGDFFAKVSTVAPQAASAFGLILGLVERLVGWIGNLLVIFGKLEPMAEQVIVPFGRLIALGIDHFFDSLNATVTLAAGAFEFFNGATRGMPDFLKFLGDVIVWIGTELEKLLNPAVRAGDAFRSLGSALGPLGGLAGIVAGGLSLLSGHSDTTSGKVGGLSGAVQLLDDKLRGLPPKTEPTVGIHNLTPPVMAGINAGLSALDHRTVAPTVVVDDNTEGTLERIQNKLRELNGKTVEVYVRGVQTGTTIYHGLAEGGAIFGPGPKGVDSVLRMLAPGEHVLTAREVDAAGGHAAIYRMRRDLMNKTATPVGPRAADHAGVPTGRGGIDAQTLRQALSGMTLVIDDRSGRTAQLIARGG